MPGGRTENGRGRRCHGRTRRRQTAKERKEVMDEHRHILYAQIRLWTDSGLQRENAMRGGVLLPKRKEVASRLPYSLPGCPCPQSGIRAFVHTFPVVQSLSVRFCPPAGICAAVSSSHSLLHFRRNDHPSARQPGKINRDSDERSGGRQNRNRLGDDMTKRVAENALPENENKG